MKTKSQLADRAHAELTAAAAGLERAGALFRAVFDALVRCEGCPPPDVLSLISVGSELCNTYSGRADDEAGYFEDLFPPSLELHAEESSQGGAEGGSA